jgi:hypothetical protein
MKKILLFIGLSIFSFGAFAEKVPAVIVNKQQGGLTAIINLYNYVSYTPAELSPNGFAQLTCSGSGFTACRVPNCTSLPVNILNGIENVSETSRIHAFVSAINNVISQYETALESCTSYSPNSEKGANVPSVYTKTLAFATQTSGIGKQKKTETYVVRGVVTASTSSSSTMKVYIEKVDFNNLTAGN